MIVGLYFIDVWQYIHIIMFLTKIYTIRTFQVEKYSKHIADMQSRHKILLLTSRMCQTWKTRRASIWVCSECLSHGLSPAAAGNLLHLPSFHRELPWLKEKPFEVTMMLLCSDGRLCASIISIMDVGLERASPLSFHQELVSSVLNESVLIPSRRVSQGVWVFWSNHW